MTIESGSKRQGRYVSEAVPVPAYPGDPATVPGESVWETYRTLDPIRAAALGNAVDLLAHDPGVMVDASTDPADFVINLARKFATYLAGDPLIGVPKEAHGTPNP